MHRKTHGGPSPARSPATDMTQPPYRPHDDPRMVRRFWLWAGGIALVCFFVIPFGRYWLGW